MAQAAGGRVRWSAIGAAIAVAVGAGGLMSASASISSGERAVYVPITPCRVMDTRPGTDNVGPRSTPIGAGEAHAIAVRGANGNCSIPADAVGVVMNVAAVQPTASSFLTVYPSDATRPLAANLNWVAGQPPLSNAVTADISADGRISFYNLAGAVHVTADIVGYYVDHTHDDRYAPKREVLHVDGSNLMTVLTTPYSVNGCYTTADTAVTGKLQFDLPRGARILGATVTVLDTFVATNYTVRLERRTIGLDIGPTSATIGTQISGGAQNGQMVRHTLLTGGTEVVDVDESFVLDINFGAAQQNGVCQATIEYERPAPA
jgi:hypothetical protein